MLKVNVACILIHRPGSPRPDQYTGWEVNKDDVDKLLMSVFEIEKSTDLVPRQVG